MSDKSTSELENSTQKIDPIFEATPNQEPIFLISLLNGRHDFINSTGPNEFIKLVLGADASGFSYALYWQVQAELIKFALTRGSTYLFSREINFSPVPLRTLALLKKEVESKLFPASEYLRQVVLSYKYGRQEGIKYYEKSSLLYELVEFALEQSADANTLVITDQGVIQNVDDYNTYKLLKEKGAECSDFSKKVRKIIDTIELSESSIKDFPKKLFYSLSNKKLTYEQIPKVLHNIWLTNDSNQQEISRERLENILNNKVFFDKKMRGDWHYIVWVNEKKYLPYTVQFLEDNGIEVRQINDYIQDIRLYDQIINAIKVGKIILASDMLRYSVIEFMGGVYSDHNYQFLNEFNYELSRYDFLSNSLVNSFFAAKRHHSIIIAEVDFLKNFFDNLYPELSILNEHNNIREQTFLITAYSFAYNVIKHFNSNQNIDFVYPYFNNFMKFDGFTCNVNMEVYSYADQMEFCSNPDTLIGKDSHSEWVA